MWNLKRFYEFVSIVSLVLLVVLGISVNTPYFNEVYANSEKFNDEKRSCEVLQKESKNNPKDNNSLKNNECSLKLDFTGTIAISDSITIVHTIVIVLTDTVSISDSVAMVHTSVLSEISIVEGNDNSALSDQHQKQSCTSLSKENNRGSNGKENALENSDCVLENETQDLVDDAENSTSTDLVDNDENSTSTDQNQKKSDKSLVKGHQNKVKIIKFGSTTAVVRPLYTTVDDPANYIVSPGGSLDGVGKLLLIQENDQEIGCSGSLLPTGEHVLTAAH